MNYLQTDEDSAVEATELTTDATSPDDNWVIKVYKPAAEGNKPVVEGKPAEFVAKDLSREEDVREVLGWLNTKGWILLKEIGGGEHEWDVSRDKVNSAALSFEARRLTRTQSVCSQDHHDSQPARA